MGVEGASITIPFKLDALRAATPADASDADGGRGEHAASRRRRAGRRPTPTSPAFWRRSMPCSVRDCDGARAAVLGAGGSARAVVAALRSRGARVTVYARRPEQARELAQSLGASAGAWPPPAGSWDVLVNCTPLGGAGTARRIAAAGRGRSGPLVYDLTYGPGESRAAARRAAAGCADARRAADAGRAGRAAVRVVDGPDAGAGRDGSGAARKRGSGVERTL